MPGAAGIVNPFSEYRFLYQDGRAGLEGYLVLQIPKDLEKVRVSLVGWEAARPEVLGALVHTALKWGVLNGFLWGGVLLGEIKDVFLKKGFVFQDDLPDAQRQIHYPAVQIISTSLDIREENNMFQRRCLLEWSRWDLRGIYSDNF